MLRNMSYRTWEMRKAKFLSRLDFRASDIEYQCEVDTGAIFTIICHCSCSHVNVCHSLFNEDFVNSHWFSGDHPIPFVLNVRDKYYQSMKKKADPQGFSEYSGLSKKTNNTFLFLLQWTLEFFVHNLDLSIDQHKKVIYLNHF